MVLEEVTVRAMEKTDIGEVGRSRSREVERGGYSVNIEDNESYSGEWKTEKVKQSKSHSICLWEA